MNREREVPVRIVVRKKGHGGGHHGGAWKVAFADFMTAMFALFLVLWLVNQSSDVKSAIAGYFSDPLGRADEFGSSIMPGEGAQAATVRPMSPADIVEFRRDRIQQFAEKLEKRLQEVPEFANLRAFVEISITDEGLAIQLLEDSTGVFFESGSPAPSANGRRFIERLGQELGKLPNSVRVEGHTDARPYANDHGYSNWELSADRANSARKIMTTQGLKPEQVVEVRAHADRSLRTPNDPYAPGNRRISITVLFPDITSVPSGAPVFTSPDSAARADSIALARGGA